MKPTRDLSIDHSVSPETEPHSGFLIDSLLRPGMLVFDIGANIGDYADEYLHHGCRVVAVEPQSSCVSSMRSRFFGNPNVTILCLAVSDSHEPRDLHISSASTLSTFESCRSREGRFSPATPYVSYGAFDWPTTERVPCTTLDSLIYRYGVPDFCKVDVEGHELAVLKGLSTPLPLLSFEWEREFFTAAHACADHLSTLGRYEFNSGIDLWPEFALPQFVDWSTLVIELDRRAETYSDIWGDIHARLIR